MYSIEMYSTDANVLNCKMNLQCIRQENLVWTET